MRSKVIAAGRWLAGRLPLLAVLLAGVGLGVVGEAVISAQNDEITVCVTRETRVLRLPRDRDCPNADRELVFNLEGEPGPAGPRGAPGPQGATGPPGPASVIERTARFTANEFGIAEIAAFGTARVTVGCALGETVVGGGYFDIPLAPSPDGTVRNQPLAVLESRATSNGWTVRVYNPTGFALPTVSFPGFGASAMCATGAS